MLPFFPGDGFRYIVAVFLFWLVIIPPGLVIGWTANLLGFRSRSSLFRLYAATALGISVVPILMYLCWSLGSLRIVFVLCLVFWAAFVLLLALRELHFKDLCPPRIELLLGLGWVAFAGLLVLDLRIGNGLYINWASIDYSFRTSLIQAIHRTSVLPTGNPFFYPGHPVPFRYHYFWFMLAAFVQVLGCGFISARDALFASVAWSGLAIVAVAALFIAGPLEPERDGGNLKTWRRRTWLAAGLMAITGLDLIPDGMITLIVSLARHRFFIPFGDFEFWNGDGQVTSWLGSCVWVPNHVGGLVCGCTGVLLLLGAWRAPQRSSRIAAGLLSGLAFASAAGCSIYVVFVFVVALAGLLVVFLVRKMWGPVSAVGLAGATAFIAALPYLAELREAQGGVPFAVLRPRTFGPVFWFMHGTPGTLDVKGSLAMLLCLPLNYAMELGFFAAIGIYKLRKMRRTPLNPTDKVLLFLLVSGFLIGSFLASVALPHNDLGWRAMLVPQFVLLLWAVEWVEDVFAAGFSMRTLLRGRVGAIAVLGVIGIAGTVCDAALLRFYAVAIDQNRGTSVNPNLSAGLGERTAELRTIYSEALKGLPASSLVQESPAVPDAVQQGLYSSWASAARGRDYGPSYGGDANSYLKTENMLRPVFEQPVQLAYVADLCATSRVGAFVVRDLDPGWHEPGSWIWTAPPVYAGKHARAFMCTDILRSALSAPAPGDVGASANSVP
ncbi:MAG: hypothetical protein ABSF53_13495 [Terracidiphilus sp.]|jgi:hypothetical protein